MIATCLVASGGGKRRLTGRMQVPLEAKGSSNGQKVIFQVHFTSLISRIFSNLFQMLPIPFFEEQSRLVSIASGSAAVSYSNPFLHNRMHSKF